MGCPKREFPRLVVKAANEDSGIFIGEPGCHSLYPNAIGIMQYTCVCTWKYRCYIPFYIKNKLQNNLLAICLSLAKKTCTALLGSYFVTSF